MANGIPEAVVNYFIKRI